MGFTAQTKMSLNASAPHQHPGVLEMSNAGGFARPDVQGPRGMGVTSHRLCKIPVSSAAFASGRKQSHFWEESASRLEDLPVTSTLPGTAGKSSKSRSSHRAAAHCGGLEAKEKRKQKPQSRPHREILHRQPGKVP